MEELEIFILRANVNSNTYVCVDKSLVDLVKELKETNKITVQLTDKIEEASIFVEERYCFFLCEYGGFEAIKLKQVKCN